MTKDEAIKWLDGTYDEQTFFASEYVNKISFREDQLQAQLSMAVAGKMKQALCVLQYYDRNTDA